MTDYVPEAEQCLAKLMEAHQTVEEACGFLRGAVDADLFSKGAIETEIGHISTRLNAIIERLDELPLSRRQDR